MRSVESGLSKILNCLPSSQAMNTLRDSSTGMLLIHEGVLMHYLEAPASTCVELLREAQELGRSRPTFGAVRGYLHADFG